MDANPWLHDPTAGNTGPEHADEHGAESEGIGNQISHALGDFDAKLTRLHEELENKKSELSELEALIGETEKAQAKAFKQLLSKNPQIKKMLGQQKKRKTTRRKKKTEPKPAGGAPPMHGDLPPELL